MAFPSHRSPLKLLLHTVERRLEGGNYPERWQGRITALDRTWTRLSQLSPAPGEHPHHPAKRDSAMSPFALSCIFFSSSYKELDNGNFFQRFEPSPAMSRVHVFITRRWNKPLSLVLLAFNNTHPKTSLAGCNESLRSWFRAGQCKYPKHNKTCHIIPPAPLHGQQPPNPTQEQLFHPKSPLPHQPPTPAPPSHAGQRPGRLFPACRHVSHETQGQEQGSCLRCLCTTCRLCVVGLYSQPANTRAGNAVGMAAANGSRQERSHVGNLKCKRSWECVACPSERCLAWQDGRSPSGLIVRRGVRAGSVGSGVLGEGLG